MLQMMDAWREPLAIDDATLALDAIREVGPGGHFFGAAHTMERYETAFYAPLLTNWDNHPQWLERGSVDTRTRANTIWKQLLADHQDPGLDPAIDAELTAFVAKRKEQGGAPMN
jgi:trimethylamine---corrinoid protein Co-methyltransferase